MGDLDGWVTTEEARKLVDYTPEHLRRIAKQGRVETRQIGRTWLFNSADLLRYHAEVKPGRPKEKT